MPRIMPAESAWLRATVAGSAVAPARSAAGSRSGSGASGRYLDTRGAGVGRRVGVDRENAILNGFILAQSGPFKSAGRGEFDMSSLLSVIRLGNASPKGLKSRFSHPNVSADGLGKYLGRARNLTLSLAPAGRTGSVDCVRGDLHFDKSAFRTPGGDLATYLMDLAESDSDALSSSLVLKADMEYRTDSQGRKLVDDDGEPLAPLWRPIEIHASDIVDCGEAVDGVLGGAGMGGIAGGGIDMDKLPSGYLYEAHAMLDRVFAGQPDDVVRRRLTEFLSRYLVHRGSGSASGGRRAGRACSTPGADTDTLRRRLRLAAQGGGGT